MKIKFIIFLCILLFGCKKICEENKIMNIYYLDEDACYIVPLTEKDVFNHVKKLSVQLTDNDYELLLDYTKNCVEVFNIEMTNQTLDLFFEDEIIDNKNEKIEKWTEPINDCYLDIRYIIVITNKSNVIKIAFGNIQDILKINDKYYEINSTNFHKLKQLVFHPTNTN